MASASTPGSAGLAATLVTLILWSLTASLTLQLTHLPPAEVVAVTFLLAGLACLPFVRSWRVPLRTFLMCSLCCAAYRLVFVEAFTLSPHVETNLIFGLNTVLIVLFSPAALPGYRLRPNHIIGVVVGCAGVVLAVGYGHLHPTIRDLPAYLLAIGGAVLWALYSLALKRLPPVASTSMGGSLLGAGLITSALVWTLPGAGLTLPTATQWTSLVTLAIGPTAIAYITWDRAMKSGDPRIVASIMNLGPLTSTLLIIVINHQPMTWQLMLGAVIVVVGSFIGCLEMFQRYFQPPALVLPADAASAAALGDAAAPVADLVA